MNGMNSAGIGHPLAAGRVLIPSGLDMIDVETGGGSPSGEVNVLLGSMESCLGLVATQLVACAAARTAQQVDAGGLPRRHVSISYATKRRRIQRDVMACAAQIPEQRLFGVQCGTAQFSRKGRLAPHELTRSPEGAPGELERKQACWEYLNRYTAVPDFSGSVTGGRRLGWGGIDEIASVLRVVRREGKMALGLVIIDGVLTGCRRELETRGMDPSRELTGALARYVSRIRNEIAVPFGCVVWVVHHLKGQVCKKPPSYMPSHREAEWCRSFADAADFAFCLGNQDHATSTCLLGATKTRSGEARAPMRCRIEGEFRRIVVDVGFAGDLEPRICGHGGILTSIAEQELVKAGRQTRSKFKYRIKPRGKLKGKFTPKPVST